MIDACCYQSSEMIYAQKFQKAGLFGIILVFRRKIWFIFADFSDVFISYMWHNLGSCQIGLCFWFICILLIKNQLDFD